MASGCYVYAITGEGTPLPASNRALGDLTMVSYRTLGAVTRSSNESAGLTVKAVLDHETIVEAVRQQGPALPVRFGTVFPDAASLASALSGQYESLTADLHRLGNKVELALTALWVSPPSERATSVAVVSESLAPLCGRSYLYDRAADLRTREGLKEKAAVAARELDRELSTLAIERRISLLPTSRIAARLTYLVDTSLVDGFRAAFERVRGTSDDVRMLLTGPWPPYSFVGRRTTGTGAPDDGQLGELARVLNDVMWKRGG